MPTSVRAFLLPVFVYWDRMKSADLFANGDFLEKVCVSNLAATVTIPDRDYQSSIQRLGIQTFPSNPLVPMFMGVFEHVAEKGLERHPAYFDVYPNIWVHGDFIEINDRGGVTMCGRSDATLNPGGVRIGTADIYRLVEQMDEIEDSVVIGQNWKNDIRVILFVKLAQGYELTEELKGKIKSMLRTNASPRHVPAKILSVPAVPYTLNMKKVELAVKKVVENKPVLNKDALSNPEALDYYGDIKELQED